MEKEFREQNKGKKKKVEKGTEVTQKHSVNKYLSGTDWDLHASSHWEQ